MRELIKGQTLRVDNHKSGTGEPVEWGKGIHLHKITNNKKGKRVEVELYLDSERPIKFTYAGDSVIERQMIKEISNALKDSRKRTAFVQDVIKEIDRFSQTLSPNERRKNLRAGANRIAKHFELDEAFITEIDSNLNQCLTQHYDEKNKVCYILQDLREKTITLGEDLELVKDKSDLL